MLLIYNKNYFTSVQQIRRTMIEQPVSVVGFCCCCCLGNGFTPKLLFLFVDSYYFYLCAVLSVWAKFSDYSIPGCAGMVVREVG